MIKRLIFCVCMAAGLLLAIVPTQAQESQPLSMYSPDAKIDYGNCSAVVNLSLFPTMDPSVTDMQVVGIFFDNNTSVNAIVIASYGTSFGKLSADGSYVIDVEEDIIQGAFGATRRLFFAQLPQPLPVHTVTVSCTDNVATLTMIYKTGTSRDAVLEQSWPIR